MAARLREHYLKNVVPALTKEFGYKNRMAVPKVDKVSVNIGLGEATGNAKLMDGAVNELTAIVGQKPVITKAKRSIAGLPRSNRLNQAISGRRRSRAPCIASGPN